MPSTNPVRLVFPPAVHVFLRGGRTNELKRAFYRTLGEHVAALGVEPRNLMVVLTENTVADRSFGDGVAQYLEDR